MLEKLVRPIYDEAIEHIKGAVFFLLVDRNGYAPTHNTKYCKITGKKEIDRLYSRDKRIFNDKTGLKSAKIQNDGYFKHTRGIQAKFYRKLLNQSL